MVMEKLKRGQKLCKKCDSVNAARSRLCSSCGSAFIAKNTPIKNEIMDWRSLQKGELFRVVQGTGPYFVCTRGSEESVAGDKIYMGCKGKYEVVNVLGNGLMCKGIGKNSCGLEFLYMGSKELSKNTGINKEPHRLIKIKPRKIK
tara:strand:+ start:96 stop:530 length:435 start_codon:yes stop_codon:yes gene_type:complete